MRKKRFLLYKTVGNNKLMYITSIEAESRIDAMVAFRKKLQTNIEYGFRLWRYYVTGITR